MARSSFKVTVCIDVRHLAAREIITGILRFAARHPEIEIQMRGNHFANDGFAIVSDWRPDGLIIDGSWRDPDKRDLIKACSLKAVEFISTLPPKGFRKPHRTVQTDDKALAETAARLFLRHGLTHFAFIGSREQKLWNEARKQAFVETLATNGYTVDVYASPEDALTDWAKERAAMTTWLTNLPKPYGVWASYDQRAMHVLDVCRRTDIAVPDQIQVLGVDNEIYLCEQTVPTLSSLVPDFENAGYEAAAVLYAMMSGNASQAKDLRVGVRETIERQSTTNLSHVGNRVARAREFIRRKAGDGINVAAVVKAVGGSERLLEKNFREFVGHSVCREIQEVRLEHVKQLLAKTALPIATIAARCHFRNGNYLKNLFQSRFGMTMSDFRSVTRRGERVP